MNFNTIPKMLKTNIPIAIILCLSLGLAPFFPEPHIVGKIKWLMGGGEGMGPMDYFDILLHGAPWVYLVYAIIQSKKSK